MRDRKDYKMVVGLGIVAVTIWILNKIIKKDKII